jgi:hypothetical protein
MGGSQADIEKFQAPEAPQAVEAKQQLRASLGKEVFSNKSLPITDSRTNPDEPQTKALDKQIEDDQIYDDLQKAHKFFGKYSARSPDDLSITIEQGELGQYADGEIRTHEDNTGEIILFLDSSESIQQHLRQTAARAGQKANWISEILTEDKCQEMSIRTASSTAFHEGLHGLFDTRPDSSFDNVVQESLQTTNGKVRQEVSTLLDEGTVMAIQSIKYEGQKVVLEKDKFEPDLEPKPRSSEPPEDDEDYLVWARAQLGQKLKPLVREYNIENDQPKEMDAKFIATATQIAEQSIDLERYQRGMEAARKSPGPSIEDSNE